MHLTNIPVVVREVVAGVVSVGNAGGSESSTSSQLSFSSPTTMVVITTSPAESSRLLYEALKASATQSYGSTRTTVVTQKYSMYGGHGEFLTFGFPNPPITAPIQYATITPSGPVPANFNSVQPVLVLTKVEAQIYTWGRGGEIGVPSWKKSNQGELVQAGPQQQFLKGGQETAVIPVSHQVRCTGNICFTGLQIFGIVVGVLLVVIMALVAGWRIKNLWTERQIHMANRGYNRGVPSDDGGIPLTPVSRRSRRRRLSTLEVLLASNYTSPRRPHPAVVR